MATKSKVENGQASHTSRVNEILAAGETQAPAAMISLPRLEIQHLRVHLIGDTPLICHKWSEKAKKQMLDKQMGKASSGKENKDPQRDYQDSLYVLEPAPKGEPFENSVFGFPAVAFKSAAVEACTSLGKSITKVAARQAFHIDGEFVVINGKPSPREDMVRVGMGTADIRFRGEFREWSCDLVVRFNSRVLSAEQIFNVFNVAGFAVGVGEWRSEKNGSNGLFHVG